MKDELKMFSKENVKKIAFILAVVVAYDIWGRGLVTNLRAKVGV